MATLYTGELQKTRPINATRIKDQLYIFTGTYPLYYKVDDQGEGKLYLLPEHQTTYTELLVSGHNTMMEDFDSTYYNDFENLEVEASEVNNFDETSFKVKDFDFTPKLPFTNLISAEDNLLEAKFSFSVPSSLFSSNRILYPFRVYQKAAVVGSTEADYQELTFDEQWNYRILKGDQSIIGSYELSETTDFETVFIKIWLNNIDIGFRDFKFVFRIQNPQDNNDFVLSTSETKEINITSEKIQDYPSEENPDRGNFKLKAPWTCNQVIEHYGQLLTWGSTSMPSTLFISSNDNLNYFPSLYTFTFETDQNEALNSITPFMNILVVQSKSYTWGLKGSNPIQYLDRFAEVPNPNAYTPFSINASVGSIAPKAVRPVRNRLYFLSQEGLMELTSLFATDDRYNVKPLDRNIVNLIPQDRNAVAIQFDNQYWIHFPSTGEMFRYYIDKQAWVKDTYNFKEFNGFYKFYNRDGKLHIITHPMIASGNQTNYDLYEVKVSDDLALDLGIPVTSKFLTSKMNQDYPFHWKRYKELKMDFSIQNEYLPDLEPVEITNTDYDDDNDTYTIFANFLPNHKYSLALNLIPTYDEEDEEFTYSSFTNLAIENASQVSYSKGVIEFMIGNVAPEFIVISYENLTSGPFIGATLQDETYNDNLAFNVKVISDNSSMIRDVDVASTNTNYNLPLVSQELGVMANTFEDIFENSQFGKAYKFVHTNKLYGSGYDLEMYYEDNANVKWTLETIGVTYKMRRTRSR